MSFPAFTHPLSIAIVNEKQQISANFHRSTAFGSSVIGDIANADLPKHKTSADPSVGALVLLTTWTLSTENWAKNAALAGLPFMVTAKVPVEEDHSLYLERALPITGRLYR